MSTRVLDAITGDISGDGQEHAVGIPDRFRGAPMPPNLREKCQGVKVAAAIDRIMEGFFGPFRRSHGSEEHEDELHSKGKPAFTG